MVAQIAQAAAAYADVAGRSAGAGMEPRDDLKLGTFADMVRDQVTNAVGSVSRAEAVSQAAVAGQADLNEVVLAVNSAEITLQTVVSVRDRMIEAYQSIIRMPV